MPPFENICYLWFSCKLRKFEFFPDGLLHISRMGWEVKNDMSGQSKDALSVCNVKIRKSLLGRKWGTHLLLFQLAAPGVK